MLKLRLAVGLPLAALFLLGLLWPGPGGAVIFFALCTAMAALALREYFTLAATLGLPGYPTFTVCAAVLTLGLIAVEPLLAARNSLPGPALDSLVIVAFLVLGFVRVFADPQRQAGLTRLGVSLAGFVGLFWCLSFIPRLYFSSGLEKPGRDLVIFLVVVTKFGDIGAYIAGSLTARRAGGNHKVVPVLSPKKSWEGCFGGLAASVLAAWFLVRVWPREFAFMSRPVLGVASALFLGVLFAVLGFAGDLAESALKRAAGAKNSGDLPGLGGMLDVLDSLIFVSPAFYAYLHLAVAFSDPGLPF